MTDADIADPRRPQARRRPVRLGPVARCDREALRRAGRDRHVATRHVAPAGAGQERSSAGSATGLAELFSLPDGYEVVLGNGGSTAFWDIATFGLIRERSQHLSFGEFSAKFAAAAKAAPFLGDPSVLKADPGSRAAAARRGGRRRLRLAAQRDLDRRAWRRSSRVAGADDGRAGRWSTPPPAPAGCRSTSRETDVYYFAPQKSFASDGGLWLALMSPRGARAGRADRGVGRWIPAFLDLHDRDRQLPPGPDVQHPGAGDAVPAGRAARLAQRQRRARLGVDRTADSSSAALRLGREVRRTRRRSSPTRRSARRSSATIDFDDAVDAAAVAKALRANGIVDTEPYRKLGRNQLRVAMFPAIEPDDVEALDRVHRLRRVGDVLAAGASPARKRDRDGGGDQAADEQDRCGQGFVDLGAVGADVGCCASRRRHYRPPDPVNGGVSPGRTGTLVG